MNGSMRLETKENIGTALLFEIPIKAHDIQSN